MPKPKKFRKLKLNESIAVHAKGDQRTPAASAITAAQWNLISETAEASAKALEELAKDFNDMREAMRSLREELARESRTGHIGD